MMSRRAVWVSRLILLLCTTVAVGCGRPKVEGIVVDNFGNPVRDAKVAIAGTTLADETGRDGRYAVPFVPGQFTVRYEALGHVTEERSFTIASESSVPAEVVILVRVPPEPGIWLVDGDRYVPIARGLILECSEDSARTERVFSVTASPTLVRRPPKPGGTEIVFVDNFPGRKLLLRDGWELMRQTRRSGFVGVVKEEIREARDLLVRKAFLEPGRYSFLSIEDDRRWAWRPGEAGFSFHVLLPNEIPPTSVEDEGKGAWSVLKPGESRYGLSMSRKGLVMFGGRPLGKTEICSGSNLRVSQPSPRKGYVYTVFWDGDHGGIDAYVIDPRTEAVQVREIVQRYWAEGYSYPVRNTVGPEIVWSPDERYAVTQDIGEVQEHINVIDLEARHSTHLDIGELKKSECEVQWIEMGGSRWRSPTELVFRVDIAENPWSDVPCPANVKYPRYEAVVNVETLKGTFERKS